MLNKLNIVRDCYWLMSSGDNYLQDENGILSSHTNGLYTSLNTDNNDYIVASDSGNIRYYGRLESTNIDTTGVYATLRASCDPDGSAVLSINNYEMLSIPVSGGINDYETTVLLNDQQIDRIHYGRIDNNYDYFDLDLDNQAQTHTWRTPDFWLNSQGIYPHIDTSTYPYYNGSGVITDGDLVGAWASSGTQPCLMFQDNGAEYKPSYFANAVAGKPALRFWEGSGLFLEYWWSDNTNENKPRILTASSGEIYIIGQKEKSVSNDAWMFNMQDQSGTENTYWRIGLGLSPETPRAQGLWNVSNGFTNYVLAGKGSMPLGTPYMLGLHTYDGIDLHHTVDGSGVSDFSTDNSKRKWWDQFNPQLGYGIYSLGGQWDGLYASGVNFEFDGFIAEVLAFNTPLSSGEKLALYTYVNTEYGLGVAYVPPSTKLLDFEIYYSGENTWDNYQTGLPNVTTDTYWAKAIVFPAATRWDGTIDAISSGVSVVGVDDAYIEFNGSDQYVTPTFYGDPRLRKYPAQVMPSGYLGIKFDDQELDSFTKITRARMNVRMSLPLASGDNKRDNFEINGYNPYYKNQDYREDLEYVNSSQSARDTRFGYYTYGAGTTVEQSGFQTYNVELNFLDPILPSGHYNSIKHASSDMLANMEFQFIGLPSGTRMSGIELQVEYLSDEFMPMYTLGSNKIYRCPSSGVIDAGTSDSYAGGHGGWHHQGWRLRGPNVVEEDVFTNFYTFSEGPAHTRTYPETTKTYYFPVGDKDSTVYADYIILPPYNESDITSLLKDPQRREYYRNPINATDLTPVYEGTPRDISSYKPHYYRHMIYHGASLDYVDVNLGNGDATSLASDDLCQIYFEDRISLGESFTLYFVLYRDYGFQSYGRFFHRGLLEYQGVENYEIYGDLEPNLVRFTVQGANGTDNRVEVEINQYTKEPILIWFTCGYEEVSAGMTTMTLCVHQDAKNYFSQDWIRTQRSFQGRRKEYTSNSETVYRPDGTPYTNTWGGSRTCIGTLVQLNVYEQMARRLYLHHVSPVEFGYKTGEAITLDYTTSLSTTQVGYDTSNDKDKFFLRTRLANSQYLQHNPSGVRWVVPDGSGDALWRTSYNVFESWNPDNIYSIYNPVSTAGTNHIVNPSAVYVELDLVHSTNHPSGLTVHVDVEFDSGTSDNWKVAHTTLVGIPSGGAIWSQYAPIKYNTATNEHINMDDGPIKWTDLENINITMTTEYPGDGENSYNGSVEIRSMRIFLDSYCVAATGINDLDLYTAGGSNTLSEPRLDLYVLGKETIPTVLDDGSLDLYVYGVALQSSGDMTLYTNGVSSPLISPDDDGLINLFVEGLNPPDASGSQELFVWGTNNPGIREFSTLFTHSTLDPKWMLPLILDGGTGAETASINLYIAYNPPKATTFPSGLSMYINGPTQNTNTVPLYINTPSGTDGWFVGRGDVNLYIDRATEAQASRLGLYMHNTNITGSINNFIQGVITAPSSVPLYMYGSGAPPSNNIELFTGGF